MVRDSGFMAQEKKVESYIVVKFKDKQGIFKVSDFSDDELAELKKVLFMQMFKPDVRVDTEVVCEFLRKINEELQNRVNEKALRESPRRN